MNRAVHTVARARPAPTSSFVPARTGFLQRKCPSGTCDEDRERLPQELGRSPLDGEAALPAAVEDTLLSPGQPLEPATRARMEARFGHNFGQVRVHADARAAGSARAVNALAYTVGRDVVFGAGQYAPGTRTGQRLIAHELAHVVQQASGATHGRTGIAPAGDAYERQADAFENPPDVDLEDDEFALERAPCASRFCALGDDLARREATRPGDSAGDLADGPHQDSATIVCDGAGDYRVHMGWAASATCGIGDCVRGHEESHARDWRGRWPDGCKNADGTPKPDGTRVPTGGDGYAAFLKASECRAYTGEVPCGERLLAGASDECKPTVERQLGVWRTRKASYCS
ncbi:MAG: eCIS core domain-containing protein [Chloroflexota bacterium]